MLFKIRSIRAYLRGDLRSLCTTLWDYFLEFPFLCDLSDTFCLLEVPLFQPSSQKTGPLVSPLCYVFLPGAFVSGAKFYWKTEKNATDIWPMILGPLLLCLKGMIFLPQNFRHLQWLLPPTMGLPGVWDWREWKIIVNLPPLWPLKRVPFSDSWTRRRNLLLATLFACTQLHSQPLCCFLSQGQLITEGYEKKKARSYWRANSKKCHWCFGGTLDSGLLPQFFSYHLPFRVFTWLLSALYARSIVGFSGRDKEKYAYTILHRTRTLRLLF